MQKEYKAEARCVGTVRPEWWRDLFSPPPELSVSQWCETHLVVPYGAKKGPLRLRRTPYLREPLDSIADLSIRQFTICSATQVGKTMFLLLSLSYLSKNDPGPALCVFPNSDLAESFCESKVQPFVKKNRKFLVGKAGKMNKSHISINGMDIWFVGSNSPTNLSSRDIRYLFMDEVDKYPGQVRGEAPAAELAIERTRTYWDAKIFRTSTPTVYTGEIWKSLMLGDQRHYHVPCPSCGAFQKLEFSSLKWPASCRGENGEWDKDAVRESSQYECVFCKYMIKEHEREEIENKGQWIPESLQTKKHRSWHLSGLHSLWQRWGDRAVMFLESKNDRGKLQSFKNSALAEVFSEVRADQPKEEEILSRRLDYSSGFIPTDELPTTVILTIDVQHAACYYVVRAWYPHGTSYQISRGIIEASKDLYGLLPVIERSYNHKSGANVKVEFGYIDAGDGNRTLEIYNFCEMYGINPLKGFGEANRTTAATFYYSRVHDNKLNMLFLNTSACRTSLYRKIKISKGDPGAWYLPQDADFEFAQHLTANVPEDRIDKNGRPETIWKQIRPGDHWGDCEAYQIGVANALEIGLAPQRESGGSGTPEIDDDIWKDIT